MVILSNWINYYGDGKPTIDYGMMKLAKENNMFLIHVICEGQEDSDTDSFSGVTFVAMTYAIPRVGENISLEDGSICEVTGILHGQSVGRTENIVDTILLVPNVRAKFKHKVKKQGSK